MFQKPTYIPILIEREKAVIDGWPGFASAHTRFEKEIVNLDERARD